jgi:hypothetical protein
MHGLANRAAISKVLRYITSMNLMLGQYPGEALVSTPYPTGYIIPGANASFLPNNVAAAILTDGNTIAQIQPATKCLADGPNTAFVSIRNTDFGPKCTPHLQRYATHPKQLSNF